MLAQLSIFPLLRYSYNHCIKDYQHHIKASNRILSAYKNHFIQSCIKEALKSENIYHMK